MKGAAPRSHIFSETRKERRCLTCSKMFLSEWIGNRMCTGCKSGANKVHEAAQQRGRTRDSKHPILGDS